MSGGKLGEALHIPNAHLTFFAVLYIPFQRVIEYLGWKDHQIEVLKIISLPLHLHTMIAHFRMSRSVLLSVFAFMCCSS